MGSLPQAFDAAAYLALAKPVIDPLIDTFVKPKLIKMLRGFGQKRDLLNANLENSFRDYLERSIDKYSYMNTLALGSSDVIISDLYIPLTLECKAYSVDRSFRIDRWNDNFIPHFKKVLISDSAGMGKSTIMKWIFIQCFSESSSIPVFIELRKLREGHGVLDEILSELKGLEDDIDDSFIMSLIKRGDFTFILDGFDEIRKDDRVEVAKDIRDFITKASNNWFVMTSRPESGLASFGDFVMFEVKSLNQGEAFELIRKYSRNSEVADELISKLMGNKLKSIEEFLGNPLLVSLLYKSYTYKPAIPFKKHLFYRQVFDALYEFHDYSKDGSYERCKKSNLDMDDFHRVMRAVAYITSVKLGQIEYDRDQLAKLIDEIRPLCPGVVFGTSDLINDLVVAVPLFYKDGDMYRWAHKSIQDYFCACFVYQDSGEARDQILAAIFHNSDDSKFYNVMDIYYDLDAQTFMKVIVSDMLNSFIHHYDNSFANDYFSRFDASTIDPIRSMIFDCEVSFRSVDKSFLNSKAMDREGRKAKEVISKPMVTSIVPNKDRIILITYGYGKYNSLSRLLRIKGMDIFMDVYEHNPELELPVYDNYIKIDDNPNNPVYKKKNYLKSAYYISTSYYGPMANDGNSILLDYNKCKKELASIDKELAMTRELLSHINISLN